MTAATLSVTDPSYTVTGFLEGAGSVLIGRMGGTFSGARPEVMNADTEDADYLPHALVPMSSETHSGEDVAIYATAPWAHLFDGTMEQNYIFHEMMHVACRELGRRRQPGASLSSCKKDVTDLVLTYVDWIFGRRRVPVYRRSFMALGGAALFLIPFRWAIDVVPFNVGIVAKDMLDLGTYHDLDLGFVSRARLVNSVFERV